ncbi:MAG: aldo/keto reductase [Planctomycetota bacterium]|jgi:diketogulonate reductase-like aldo/keto reductase
MLDIASTVKLRSGHEMPLLGFGVFQIADGEECERAVREALDAGYRHIDTAAMYGNERSVGRAIAASGVPRGDVFVTTKVPPSQLGREKTRAVAEKSLGLLGMDYVDLLLIHWPLREGVDEAWDAMREMRDEGKLRSIGVSNFTVRRFEEQFFKSAGGDAVEAPAVDQIELHPFLTRRDLLAYCREKAIQPEGYSPLARAERMDDPVLTELAKKYGKTVAQVMIRWQLQQSVVVIPKSSRPERIKENAKVFDFEISDDDMARIDALDEGFYTIKWRPEEGWI